MARHEDQPWCGVAGTEADGTWGAEVESWVVGRVGEPWDKQGWQCLGAMVVRWFALTFCIVAREWEHLLKEEKVRSPALPTQKSLHSPFPYYCRVIVGFTTSSVLVLHGAKTQSKEANSSHVLQRELLYPSQACEAHPSVTSGRAFVSTGRCSLRTTISALVTVCVYIWHCPFMKKVKFTLLYLITLE